MRKVRCMGQTVQLPNNKEEKEKVSEDLTGGGHWGALVEPKFMDTDVRQRTGRVNR